MTDTPHFADMPPEFDPGSGWFPVERDGHARIGLAPRQMFAWGSAAAIATFLVLAMGTISGSRALLALALLLAGSQTWAILRTGIELTPEAIVVRGLFRARQTVAWSAVQAVGENERGQVRITVAGDPIVAFAPQRRWLAVDPDFDAKFRYLNGWWLTERGSAPNPVDRTVDPLGPSPRSDGEPVIGATGGAAASGVRLPRLGREAETAETADAVGFPIRTLLLLLGSAVVVGYLFVGRDVLILAIGLVVLLRFGRDPGRPLALAAFALLVIAAIATIAQDPSGAINTSYASRRTLAAEAGAIVGVFLVLATIIFAFTERSPEAAPKRPVFRRVSLVEIDAFRRMVPRWAAFAAPYVPIGFIALAIRLVLAPAALPPAYNLLIENLRLGTGYSLAAPSGGVPVGTFPPLSSTFAAYFPLGPTVILLLVSLGTVALVARAAYVQWGRGASVLAAATAAVLPSLWAQQLPIQLAGLLVLGGVVLAEPRRLTTTRAALAGLCLGGAFLARPDAGAALVVVVVWLALEQGWRARGDIAALLATAGVVIAPWLNFVWTEFGLPWPMSTLAATLNDPTTRSRFPAVVAFALGLVVVVAMVPALRARRDEVRTCLPYIILPVISLGLMFTNVPEREPIGWSAPLVTVLFGPWLASLLRRHWRNFRYSAIAQVDALTWDDELDAARARAGAGATWRRNEGYVDPDQAIIDPEPDDDHLFM